MTVTRFAPSPTGNLHLGHAYSALYSERVAKENGGKFLLRIEDIDHTRCRSEHIKNIYDDLEWLGIVWESNVIVQSSRLDFYKEAANKLNARGLLYPCFCTRKDIAESAERTVDNANAVYSGKCLKLTEEEIAEKMSKGLPYSLRLNSKRAKEETGKLFWNDQFSGVHEVNFDALGDIVLVRKDIGTSYHLAVTLDDDLQDVTCVTRGVDLYESTHVHRILQALLQLNVPEWSHHKLIKGVDGNKYSKSDQSLTLKELRGSGVSAREIRKELGF